jgi:hypothetical protein
MRSLSGRVVRASNPVIMWRKMAQQVLQRNHVGTKTSRDQYEQVCLEDMYVCIPEMHRVNLAFWCNRDQSTGSSCLSI